MNKQMLKRVLAFVLMAAVMVGLVFFRSENNYDKHYFRAKLARGQEVYCQIDLGKEGELKYLLQPNIYTLYLRLLPEDKQAQLRCEGEGLQMLLSRSSKKGLWRKLQLPQIPVHPAPCVVMPLTGIPIAATKFISFPFICVSSRS